MIGLVLEQLFASIPHSANAPQYLAKQLESNPCDLTREEAPMKRSGQTLLGQRGGCLYILLNLVHSLGHRGPFAPLDGASGSPFGPALWRFSHKMWCHDDANLPSDVSFKVKASILSWKSTIGKMTFSLSHNQFATFCMFNRGLNPIIFTIHISTTLIY